MSDEGGGREHERDPGTESGTDVSASHTPNWHAPGTHMPPLKLDSLTFSGPALHISDALPSISQHPSPPRGGDVVLKPPAAVRQGSTSSSAASGADGNGSGGGDEAF